MSTELYAREMYRASHCESTNSLLPLVRNNTLDVQVHKINLNVKATSALSPNQTPVDVSDCPVYALTKEVKFPFPERFANYFGMFGWSITYWVMLVGYSWTVH